MQNEANTVWTILSWREEGTEVPQSFLSEVFVHLPPLQNLHPWGHAAATRRSYPEEPGLLSLPTEVSGLATRKNKLADTWSGVIPCHFSPPILPNIPTSKQLQQKGILPMSIHDEFNLTPGWDPTEERWLPVFVDADPIKPGQPGTRKCFPRKTVSSICRLQN